MEYRYIKIKVPAEQEEKRVFYRLLEMARIDRAEYLVVMTPEMFEQLKTEKMIYDKIKGEWYGNRVCRKIKRNYDCI